MILLDCENFAILNILRKKSIVNESGKYESIEAKIPDDDGISYHLYTNPEDKSKIFIDIVVPFKRYFKDIDVSGYLSKIYKNIWVSGPQKCDFQLIHDCALGDKEKEDSCLLISLFRRNLYGAFLDHLKSKMSSGSYLISMIIRTGEIITFQSASDRVTVTYTIALKDQNDIITSRVFLNEFKEGRKAGKNAPAISIYLKDPPGDLASANLPVGQEVGHISFTLTNSHLNESNMSKTIDCVHNFFPYFKYHLSCSKAYLHSRMRSKTEDFIKVLNRARPESGSTDKKTKGPRTAIKT